MAALLDKLCRSCGQRHQMLIEDADFFVDGATYEYACPKAGCHLRFTVHNDWGRVVQERPPDSVPVHRL